MLASKPPEPLAWPTVGRVFIVVVLGVWTLGTIAPSLVSLWQPQGDIGLRADYDGRIMQVDADGPAARAGIRAHDRIDLALTPSQNRRYVAPNAPPPSPGAVIELNVEHAAQSRSLTIRADSEMLSAAGQWSVVARVLQALIYVIVGGLLVLVRPSRATWGFYLSCLGINQPPPQTYALFGPTGYLVVAVCAHLLFAAGTTGFLIFALRFPHDQISGWRRTLERCAPLVFVVTAGLFLYADFAPTLFGKPAEAVQVTALVWAGLVGLTVFLALLHTYFYGDPQDCQRIRWVIVGFGVGVGCAIAAGFLGYSSLVSVPGAAVATNILLFLTVIEPITVAYAVIRYRVLDVRLAISRALVYGILTSGAIIVFGIIDWLFEHVLAATRLAIVAEIAASIAIGFGLNSAQKRVDGVIDRVFFRKRHEADVRLGRIAAALPHASGATAVDEILVREPLDAWQLASAALFRRSGKDSTFLRNAAIGWEEATRTAVDADDVLFLQLQAEVGPLRIAPLGWSLADLPVAATRPALAVPVFVRHTLVAVALYGAPLSGEDFDTDEIRLLRALATGAAAAYDHLEAEALRTRVRELERLLDTMQAGVPAAR